MADDLLLSNVRASFCCSDKNFCFILKEHFKEQSENSQKLCFIVGKIFVVQLSIALNLLARALSRSVKQN